jgi:hypothetical protein
MTPPSKAPRRKRTLLKHSRRRSVPYMLSTVQLRESLKVGAPPSPKNATIAGMQAALSVLLAMMTIHFSPWSDLVGFPALGALAALFGRYASMGRRRTIVFLSGLLLTLGVTLPSLIAYTGASPAMMVIVLALGAGASTIAVSRWRLGGPGAVIIVFAVGAALGPVESLGVVAARMLTTAWGAGLAWLVCMLTDHWRTQDVRVPGASPARGATFQAELVAGARITAGAATAALVTFAAGWDYPAWAAIGATAVMQGGHLHLTINRSLQRMAGTVVGACIVWAILAQSPPFWAILLAIVFFQFITEIIIGYNYALGQITITPMALLMTHLVAPVVDGNLPVERVIDTIVGAGLGIVFALIFSSADDRAYFMRRQKKLQSRR